MTRKVLASIQIKDSHAHERGLFASFLHSQRFPEKRAFILRSHPGLERALNESDVESRAIQKYLTQYYRTNKHEIRRAVFNDRRQIQQSGALALRTLGKMMDYRWKRKTTYVALPTILPFSPYRRNVFFFSLLGRLRGKQKTSILHTAIHEISHFLFFEIQKDIEGRLRFHLSNDMAHFLKEALTTALLNEKPLKKILHIHSDKGNPEIHELCVAKHRGQPITFANWIQHEYQVSRKQHVAFKALCERLIRLCHQHERAFQRKRRMWNQYGMTVFQKPGLLRLYRAPIHFKKGA